MQSMSNFRRAAYAFMLCTTFGAMAADDFPAFMKETYPKQALGAAGQESAALSGNCLLYTSPSPRD